METNTHPECYIYMMDQGSHVTASIVGSIYSTYQCDAANHSVYVLGGVHACKQNSDYPLFFYKEY